MRLPLSERRLKELGAWAYGLSIISELVIPRVAGTDTPKYFTFDLTQAPSKIAPKIQPWANDWAIKYSCCGPLDFSHAAQRGDNSSLGRTVHLGRQSHEFVTRRLKRLFYHAPQHAAKIVFQELIDQSGGYLLHADLGADRLELEVLYNSHRVLAIWNYVSELSIETSNGNGLSSEEEYQVRGMLARLQECREVLVAEYACDDWAIEGFWELAGPKLRLLQLRPAPLDRPRSTSALNSAARDAVFDSGFVWGVCDKAIIIHKGEVEASGALSLCQTDRQPYDLAALSGFESGALDLVVRADCRSASRLSHEPWFLPPPEHRTAFCHVWIPMDVIARFDGEKLRLVSDGDRARLMNGRVNL